MKQYFNTCNQEKYRGRISSTFVFSRFGSAIGLNKNRPNSMCSHGGFHLHRDTVALSPEGLSFHSSFQVYTTTTYYVITQYILHKYITAKPRPGRTIFMVAVGEKLFAIVYLPASLCQECWELLPAVSRWETGIGWKLWTLSRYPFSENLAAYCSTNTGKAGFNPILHDL